MQSVCMDGNTLPRISSVPTLLCFAKRGGIPVGFHVLADGKRLVMRSSSDGRLKWLESAAVLISDVAASYFLRACST